MAKKITIGWVRRIYGAPTAADFGEAFGKEARIGSGTCADVIDVLRLDRVHRFASFVVRHLSADRLHTIISQNGTEDQLARLDRWINQDAPQSKKLQHGQRKPTKRRRLSDPRLNLVSRIRAKLAAEQREAVIFEVFEMATDNAFTVCNHEPDFNTARVDPENRRRHQICCAKACGAVGWFRLEWPDESDDEDDDEEEEEEEEEEDDYDCEPGD